MSLPHALLTALIEKPSSGSDLAARFDRSIGYFWQATHQQIYRELARMETNGLVSSKPEENARGRKRAYKVLSAGREELKRWTAETADPNPFRDDLMVRLRAEAAVGPTPLAEALVSRRDRHQAQRVLYQEIETKDFTPAPTDREGALRHMVLKSGLQFECYWIEILEQALEVLNREYDPPVASKNS